MSNDRAWSYADRPRTRNTVTIEKVTDTTITYDGWTFGPPAEHMSRFHEGQQIVVETIGFSMVTGIALTDPMAWLWLKTSEQLDREHDEMLAGFRKRRLEQLEEHREDWTRREAALPSPLRRRLERYRANGGDDFDADGWGYELIVCELAVLYAASNGHDSTEVNEFASREGTSGNQHDYARALAPLLKLEDRHDDIANSVSALTPISGDHDYSKAGR